jgi:hypothetical protein
MILLTASQDSTTRSLWASSSHGGDARGAEITETGRTLPCRLNSYSATHVAPVMEH